MTTYKAAIIRDLPTAAARRSTITIAGTVQSGGSPAVRVILIYKNQNTTLLDSTTSGASGDFSIEVNGGSNDCFRVICVGIANENSVIYEHVCS
jgi:hypothetical protein